MKQNELDIESGSKNILDLYQTFTPTTFVKSGHPATDLHHIQMGLLAEAGEVAGAYQKYYRADYDEDELINRLKKELGGLLYYISQLANFEGIRLTDVLVQNRDILIDRQNRNMIKGDGDDR